MDSVSAGSPGTSGVRIVTRKYLYDYMKQENLLNFEENLNSLGDELLSCEGYDEDQMTKLKHDFARFKSEFKQKWIKAHYKEDDFLKNNLTWLDATFEIPSVATLQKRTGRPSKLFKEASVRSKRRKTEELRSGFDKEVIIHAAQLELGKSGKRDASNVLKDITSTPTRASKYKKAFCRTKSSKEHHALTPMQALQMFIDADLTQGQYEIIRKTNKKFFPCYSVLQKDKKQCYPPPETCTITSTSAEAQLQPLLDITVRRLSEFLEEVLLTTKEEERETITLISKWGFDGSQQSKFRQRHESDANSDANLFQSCFVPLQLACGHDNKKVLWKNPTPSSPRFCRPIRFRFIKESNDVTTEEIRHIESSISSLAPTEVDILVAGNKFFVKHTFIMTMVDGKVCNAATATKSTSKCYICGATTKDFNDLSNDMADINFTALQFGISVLHARIRIYESILHLAYKLEVKKYKERKTQEEKDKEERKKKYIQDRFRTETGLLVDMPKHNFGNTNNGNSSRRFFENPRLASEITGIDYELLYRLKVILKANSSRFQIDPIKYKKYALETAHLYVKLYNWHPMTPTMHKVLIHGDVIIEKALLPIGELSEEAAEARNKHFRSYRQDFARKFSRENCNEDIFNRLLLSSDPLLSSMREVKKRKANTFMPKTLDMLSAEPYIIENSSESEHD